MEVVEHVDNPQKFLASLSECAKDDGLIMLSTIQRNFATWLTHIVMAEKVMKVVPSGTHHHEKFINPSELRELMSGVNIELLDMVSLDVNWKGELVEKEGGGNYMVMGRKIKTTQA